MLFQCAYIRVYLSEIPHFLTNNQYFDTATRIYLIESNRNEIRKEIEQNKTTTTFIASIFSLSIPS